MLAYVCSHILAYDVQVYRGVLQLCTAGAGTAHRMPEGLEYLHCVQEALDADGLRCRVVDAMGQMRERLSWLPVLPPARSWSRLPPGAQDAAVVSNPGLDRLVALRFAGTAPGLHVTTAQTLLCAHRRDGTPLLWAGLCGPAQVLTVSLSPQAGRSPHHW